MKFSADFKYKAPNENSFGIGNDQGEHGEEISLCDQLTGITWEDESSLYTSRDQDRQNPAQKRKCHSGPHDTGERQKA